MPHTDNLVELPLRSSGPCAEPRASRQCEDSLLTWANRSVFHVLSSGSQWQTHLIICCSRDELGGPPAIPPPQSTSEEVCACRSIGSRKTYPWPKATVLGVWRSGVWPCDRPPRT